VQAPVGAQPAGSARRLDAKLGGSEITRSKRSPRRPPARGTRTRRPHEARAVQRQPLRAKLRRAAAIAGAAASTVTVARAPPAAA
jgi:hypothetical protein